METTTGKYLVEVKALKMCIRDRSKGIPKILLTATPLQNSLTDLHGLVAFIDQRIFGSEKVFNKRYIEGQDYSDLKREL